jgi:nucleoside-diphosphate-sugar epimerase
MHLVAGASSGLGRFLAQQLPAQRFDRTTMTPDGALPAEGYDLIVHCAFGMPGKDQSAADYNAANLRLADMLLALPHRRFVFISSVDVLADFAAMTTYAASKLAVEEHVTTHGHDAVIVRAGALLGLGMRPSQLLKTARGETGPFSLAGNSTFQPLFYDDVLAFLAGNPPAGTHVLAGKPVTLQNVADAFGTQPQFGGFTYETPAPARSAAVAGPLADDPLQRLKTFVNNQGWEAGDGEDQ